MNKRHYEHTLPNIRGSLSNTYVGPAVTFLLFSLFSVPFCLNRCRDFMLQPKAVGKAAHVVFSCQLLLAAPAVKEEFARNALQNVRDRRDGLYLQR